MTADRRPVSGPTEGRRVGRPASGDAPPDAAALGAEIFDLLSELVARMQDHLVRTTAAFDLPPAQARALLHLSTPLPMRALAEILQCDASNVTGIVDGLESRGLVERRPVPDDRRVKHLVVTDKGRRIRSRLHARLHQGLPAIEELTAQQRRELRDILRQMRR